MIDHRRVGKELLDIGKPNCERFNSRTLLFEALGQLRLTKNNLIANCVIFSLGLFLGILILYQNNTIEITSGIVEKILDVQLSIFASVLAVYAIIIAFFSDEMIFKLTEMEDAETGETSLTVYVKYFEAIITLYFVNICVSCIYYLGVTTLSTNPLIFGCNETLRFITGLIFISLYLIFSLRSIYELKSTIYNTSLLFRYTVWYRFFKNNKPTSNSEDTK